MSCGPHPGGFGPAWLSQERTSTSTRRNGIRGGDSVFGQLIARLQPGVQRDAAGVGLPPQAQADLGRDRLRELGVEQAADHVRRGGRARRRQPQPVMKSAHAADQVGRLVLGQLAIGGVDLPLLARSIDEAVIDADVEVVLAERLREERAEVGQVRPHQRMKP